ncbi:MAG: (2Fe-2S) ferredoxin domain-containing protein [Sphingomonas sp.]
MAAGLEQRTTARWTTAIMVCAKCSKRLDGGFGNKGKHSLAKALRRHLGIKRFRKSLVGVVEVKCLGVCPRGSVTVVDAGQPDQWRLIPAGTDMADVAACLGLSPAERS